MPLKPSYFSLFFYVALSLVIQAACLVLFNLSQFGQNPFPQLPVAVIVFFGLLFVSPLMGLLGSASAREKGSSLTVALILNALLYLLIQNEVPGASWYFLAPLLAIGTAFVLPRAFPKNAALMAAMLVYIVCTLLANYTFDSFIPLPLYGLVNVGTLFFGVTFTQRDRVHGYGRKYAYLMIAIAALSNVVVALSLGTPLRYVAVGFLAIMLSEVADTEVYQRFIDRRWITRVATSNAVSIPIDTIVFTVLAFYGEAWATPAWMLEVIVTDMIVKLIVGFLAAIRVIAKEKQQSLKAV